MHFEINLYKSRGLNKVISLLFLCTLILLPYDAIEYLSSMYRPLSLIPLVGLFVLLIPKIVNRIDKPSLALVVFYLLSNLITLVQSLILDIDTVFFMDYFITSTIGLMIFLTANIVFAHLKEQQSVEEYKVKFAKVIAIAYVFPIFVALIDFLSINGILPLSVSSLIHSIFGGAQEGRVCGFTLEASWLSMHLFFSFFSYVYLLKKKIFVKLDYLMMIISFIVFVLLFSMQGYIYLALLLVCYWFYRVSKNVTYKNVFIPLVLIVIVIVSINILANLDTDIYFLTRFKNLSLDYLLHNDASIYIRLLNPTMALLMFTSNPLFGVGGGCYPYYYGNYVNKFFPWGLDFYGGNNEIVTIIEGLSANTKCFYARLLGEFGLISIIYYMFLYYCVKNKTRDVFIRFWLVACFIMMLQFDSFCFFPFMIFLAFYNNTTKEEEIING